MATDTEFKQVQQCPGCLRIFHEIPSVLLICNLCATCCIKTHEFQCQKHYKEPAIWAHPTIADEDEEGD